MRDTTINNHLDLLVHKPLIYIGRASNMLIVGVGKAYNVRDIKDNAVKKSQLALHVQSSWRITNRQKKDIIVASSDFYSPCSLIEWSNDFEWDVLGNNLFDEKAKEWFSINQEIYVKEHKINSWGDLLLLFSNGDSLEVFVNSSDDSECWRIFGFNSDKEHLVITGEGARFD